MATLGTRVTIAQLASMLNTAQNPQEICTSPLINKWSWCKPIDYPQNPPLSREQFKGTQDQITQGIIFGLKVGAARTSPESLHSVTWEYVGRPKGGIDISPYRVDDFWNYEYEIADGPTIYGAGVNDGDRIRYDSASKNVTLVWRAEYTSIVDIAEIVAALQHREADYSQVYLCVMIDGYVRCCINNTAGGGVNPIMTDGVKCTSFTIPAATRFGYSENSTHAMTLFFASKTDVDNLVPAMKTEWVEVFGLTFDQPLISCVGLINKQVYLVRALAQYITSFDLVYDRGLFSISYTKGGDWDSANAYQVVFSVKDSSGATGPSTVASIDKTSELMMIPSPGDILRKAGFIPSGSAQTFTFTASFQVQQVASGSWTPTEYSDNETITLTEW